MSALTALPIWQEMMAHAGRLRTMDMRAAFAADPARAERLSVSHSGIFLDYSKNRIDDAALATLMTLARTTQVEAQRAAMFSGVHINATEDRAVLHTALRAPVDEYIEVDGRDVVADVQQVLGRMNEFAGLVRSGAWKGYDGQAITDVVNIGIGGSDLGPCMACQALQDYAAPQLNLHFISTVDGWQLASLLERLDPARTLFVVASKTFTTQETLLNAHMARAWVVAAAGQSAAVARHFAAVSTNEQAVAAFGIDPSNVFGFWNWVGGRYSMWSAVGLPILLAIGTAHFQAMLAGARSMDEHFRAAPLEQNIPVILALLGVWYVNGMSASTHLIAPYNQPLHRLSAYLQQLDMESNGKSVRLDGRGVDYRTGPVVWGESGINGQHAYYQLLHQGTELVPIDFIVALESPKCPPEHHRALLANFIAQTEALMRGRHTDEVRQALQASGPADSALDALLPHRVFEGNRPSNSIVLDRIDPHTFGALIAMYEHKVFVQGVIWGVNSFDQWGVELGKQMARTIETELSTDAPIVGHDPSTNRLATLARAALNGRKAGR